ncbi:MAG: helix-turn-helix domain-containing protein [SAR202 cluster bacterium]|nr:helix-turn-helix domain-containing protein [SAR202 cluster bacterium]MDP6512464.1 helix-turn-helix domain-containing protein [SAR202 cluster bacterium]MDP6714124.1 helix-turn-helix domain-containing protein [SAR202 cluster bacterium]
MSSRSRNTRTKILESARELLIERGYFGVGLQEVAREAGVSRQAVYLHFKSKAELLKALVHYVDDEIGVPEIMRPVREAETGPDALDLGVAAYGVIEPQIYDVASLLYAARRSDDAAEATWQDIMAVRRANIRAGIVRLQEEGSLAANWTVDEATDFAWTLLSVHTYEYLVVERKWAIDRFVEHLRSTLREILVTQADDDHE